MALDKVVDSEQLDAGLKMIGDQMREKTGSNETFAFPDGMAEGVEKVFNAGQQAEYDRFWDSYQQNGKRTECYALFAGKGWSADTLRPKYDIIPTGAANQLFFQNSFVGDLAQHFEDLGITVDFSKATNVSSLFNSSTGITRIGVVNITSAGTASSSIFAYFKGHTIDKFVVNENNVFGTTFQSAINLQNIVIEGTIANNVDIHWSPLSYDSIMSIINALKDFAGTNTTRTLTLGETNLAKLTDAEKAIATQKGWTVA